MKNHLRYPFIVAVILLLSILLFPAISATRKHIKPTGNDESSWNQNPVRAGRFLIASLLEEVDEPSADLMVTKSVNFEQVAAGMNLTYTIEVRNGGPIVAVNAELRDTLPAGLTFVSLTKPASWSCTTPDVGSGGDVICTNPSLPAASDDIFTLIVNVSGQTEPGAFFTNTATVSTITPDPNEENNSYTAATMVAINSVNVGVTQTASSSELAAGANLTYTIEVRNSGPEADNVELRDTLPGNMTFVSLTKPASWSCSTPAVGSGGDVICTMASLPATSGDVFKLVVNVPTDTPAGTIYSNTATVTTTTNDLNSEDDSSTISTEVTSADLSVTKVDTPDPVIAGNNLAYTITVNNAGPSEPSVLLTDALPANTTFVSVASPDGWACTHPGVGASGTVFCSSPSFAKASAVFTLIVATSPSLTAGAIITNKATLSSSTPDPKPGNESSTASTTVLSPATLTASKTVSGLFTPGGSVTYTVVITNAGPRTQTDNPGNEFTDVLPSSLTLVSATASSGVASANVATNTVGWNGSLPKGSSATITIQATIKSGTKGTTISNQGTVSYDADGNGTNESSAQTDDPGVAGSNNPTSFVVNTAPTISAVGVTRTAGTSASNSTVANVNDAEDAPNTLSVAINNGASATANGVTVSNLSLGAAGAVTADVVAACGATSATFTLKVTDGGGLSNTAPLAVTVNANPAPTLTYANPPTAPFGGSLTVNPATGPSDNGSVSSISVQSQGTYTGSISVNNSTGLVSLSNAAPAGTHTITIRATDNCGTTTDASFNLTVAPQPKFSISNVSVTEGNSGTTDAVFTVTLSASSSLTTKVDYQTANDTASSGSDYEPTGGTLTFNPGETTRAITVKVNGDTANEPDETFFVNLTNPQNATLAVGQGVGTILNDDTPGLRLSSNSYSVGEADGHATITVNRTGDISAATSVEYTTGDFAGLNNCDVNTGDASARCDYTAVGGTLSFQAGEATRTFTVPIINDVYVEGPESLTLTLSNATGGVVLGTPSTAALTITDDDTTTGAANPIGQREFLVRQLYLDILNREPDSAGLAAWLDRLNTCPRAGETPQSCDEIEVSSAFFRSPEAFDRGYIIYRAYEAALGRQPQYDEYQNDLRHLAGFLSADELEQRKREFFEEFVNRPEFRSRYDSQSNGQPYVDAILGTAGQARPGVDAATVVTSNRADVIARLGASQITRGQALRELVESPEVSQRFFNKAFVTFGYFAFLRRNPDAAYLHWINVLNTTGDYRDMIRGFIMSTEFRSRFGPM